MINISVFFIFTVEFQNCLNLKMPVKSVAVRDSAFHMRLLQQYLLLLKKYPILTKSVTRLVSAAKVVFFRRQLLSSNRFHV